MVGSGIPVAIVSEQDSREGKKGNESPEASSAPALDPGALNTRPRAYVKN
jgi:hypothetical protein